jgi:hypothetical protein
MGDFAGIKAELDKIYAANKRSITGMPLKTNMYKSISAIRMNGQHLKITCTNYSGF